MTNLEALKAKLTYPLSDNSYTLALLDRDLVESEDYDPDTDKRALDLAQADLIYVLCTQPQITEGGFSIRITDRYALLGVADGIYKRYGVSIPSKKTAKFVNKW